MKRLILLLIINTEYNPRADYEFIWGEINILLWIIKIS
jgi:hypothetical protein